MNYPYQLNNPYNFSSIAPRTEIIRVSGKNGADAFQMAPNSSALLLDETQPLVWLKTTDGAGYPTLTPYSITPYEPEPPVDIKSLADRISNLEEVIYVQSNTKSSGAIESNTTNQSNQTDNANVKRSTKSSVNAKSNGTE